MPVPGTPAIISFFTEGCLYELVLTLLFTWTKHVPALFSLSLASPIVQLLAGRVFQSCGFAGAPLKNNRQ